MITLATTDPVVTSRHCSHVCVYTVFVCLLSINVCDLDGSVAKWLASWTQAQLGLGSNRSRVAVR